MTKEQDTELEKLAEQLYPYHQFDTVDLGKNGAMDVNDFAKSMQDNNRKTWIAGYAAAQERITWLETANAFHKKEAEDAVKEQGRLIKEVMDLRDTVQFLKDEIAAKEKENVTLLQVTGKSKRYFN